MNTSNVQDCFFSVNIVKLTIVFLKDFLTPCYGIKQLNTGSRSVSPLSRTSPRLDRFIPGRDVNNFDASFHYLTTSAEKTPNSKLTKRTKTECNRVLNLRGRNESQAALDTPVIKEMRDKYLTPLKVPIKKYFKFSPEFVLDAANIREDFSWFKFISFLQKADIFSQLNCFKNFKAQKMGFFK